MPSRESPLFARTYDLLRWLIPLTVKFPREQRFVLASAVQRSALCFHERLIEAAHVESGALATALTRADAELDILRHYMRLCHDLHLLTIGQYEHATERLSEIGRLLGGWHKASDRGQARSKDDREE